MCLYLVNILTCNTCSNTILVQYFRLWCLLSWCILVCWYVYVLTCDENVGAVCCELFSVLFAVCCKISQTFFVFACSLNSSCGNVKRFGSLTTPDEFVSLGFLSLYKNFVWFSFHRVSTVSETESPKIKFLEPSLISSNFANCGGRYGFIMILQSWFSSWFAFLATERAFLMFVGKGIMSIFSRLLMQLQDIVTYLIQLRVLKTLKLLW